MNDWNLINARAQDILPGQYAGQVALIVTSPPYDNLRSYNGHAADFDFNAIAPALMETLMPGGVLVWVVGEQIINGSESGAGLRQALAFMDLGLRKHETLIYERWSLAGLRSNGHVRNWEYMFVFSKGKPRAANLINDRESRWPEAPSSKRTGLGRNKDAKHQYLGIVVRKPSGRRGSIWNYAAGKAAGNRDGDLHFKELSEHPAIFPQRLALDHISTWSNPGDLVMDPMAGSGTVIRAAVDLDRRALGIEVNPDYCALIHRRMAQGALIA